MEQEQQVADSGQDVSTDTSSDAGFDLDQATEQLAGDLFPSSEKSAGSDDVDEAIDHVDETQLTTETTQETQAETPPPEEVEPAPKSWPKEMHDHWGKTPKEVREYWNTREKQMLDGLDQYKGDAVFGKQMRDVINPYQALIQAQGIDGPKAVQALMTAHYRLTISPPSQKAQYFQHLAQQYGVDLGNMQQSQQQQEQVDPRYQQLQDKIYGMEQRIQAQMQEEEYRKRQEIEKQVDDFATIVSVDANGKQVRIPHPERPYFDDVADDMIPFLRAGASIQDAYDKAVWANPVTRVKVQASVQQDQQAEIKRKAQEAAEAAKKAASANIRSRDTRRTPTEQSRATIRNLDSVMADAMKEIKATRSH